MTSVVFARRSAVLGTLAIVGLAVFGAWQAHRSRLAQEVDARATAAPATSAAPPAATSTLDDRCRDGTMALVARAPGPVEVELFASGGVPAVDQARETVLELLRDYEQHASGKLAVTLASVESDATRERARKAGVQPAPMAAGSGKGELVQAYLGLSIRYGEQHGALTLDPDGVERSFAFFFANKLRELAALADGTPFRIGRVTGTNELSLGEANLLPSQGQPGPSMVQLLHNSFPFYAFEAVSLSDPVEFSDLRALFLTQPGRDLTDAELRRLDEFLTYGDKTLVVLASAVNVARGDDGFVAHLDSHRLGELLAAYGIILDSDVVLDSGAPLELRVRSANGIQTARVGHIPVATHDPDAAGADQALDQTFAGFFGLQRLAFPYASTLSLQPNKQPDASLRAVARTSARISTSSQDGALPIRLPAQEPALGERRVLAALLEGQLHSAYSNRTARGRLLVIASSQFAANPFVVAEHHDQQSEHEGHQHVLPGAMNPQLLALGASYAQQQLTSTILTFKNILDWATGGDALLPCGARLVAQPSDSAR